MSRTIKLFNKIQHLFGFRMTKARNDTYEQYWKTVRGSYGCRFVKDVCNIYQFSTVLDAGSGDGTVVRAFIDEGKKASGIELSNEALSKCRDLVEAGFVQQGSLLTLPYPDNAFDVVFSSEVLEHIPESDVPVVVRELCRVARNHLFLTISLRPSSDNNAYHPTLRSREWWEQRFQENSCVPDRAVVAKFQRQIAGAGTREVLEAGPTKQIMDQLEWFIDQQVVNFHGEIEPWFFAFNKRSSMQQKVN